MTEYTVLTPVGSFTAYWSEDEDELVKYSGSPAGIAYLDSYIENMMLTRSGGYRLTLNTLEPADLIDFCQSEANGITVIPDAREGAMPSEKEGNPMAVLDAVSVSDEFALIGEGAQILKRLDEDSDTFFADLGRLREIVLVLGSDESEGSPATINPASPEGYAAIMADKALQAKYQDNLDAMFQERITAVKNALVGLGWSGGPSTIQQKTVNGSVYGITRKTTNIGAGANIVAVYWESTGGGVKVPDDLTKTPEELAKQIDTAVAPAAAPASRESVVAGGDASPTTSAYDYKGRKSAIVSALASYGWTGGHYPAKGDMAIRFETKLDGDPWKGQKTVGATIQVIKGSGAIVVASLDDDAAKTPEEMAKQIDAAVASAVAKPAAGSTTQAQANAAIRTLSPFLSAAQRGAMKVGAMGEEAQFFRDKAVEMANIIATMPKTYEQDGKGDAAVAYLHYFKGSADWYITEKDKTGEGTEQAFGYADLGQGGELGYISIAEIVSAGAELDLHWSPKTLGEIKGGNAAPADNNAPAPTVDRMDEAKKMVYTVAGEVDGTLSPWAESGNVGWQYSKMTITKGDKTIILNIGVSAGGVVQVDGNPFDPDKNVNDNIASVRKSVAAVLPKEPDMQAEMFKPFDPASVKMPTAPQLSLKTVGRFRLLETGGWSNGYVLDINNRPKVITDAFAKYYNSNPDALNTIDAAAAESYINKFKSKATTQIEPTSTYEHKGETFVVLTNEQAGTAKAVNIKYFGYFFKAYKGAQFFTSGDDTDAIVAVKKGGKLVGFISALTYTGGQWAMLKYGVSPKSATPAPEPTPSSDTTQKSSTKLMSFNYWYNNVADMPQLVNGEWVDLETGIPFAKARESAMASRQAAKDEKEAAALLKPLRGTARDEAIARRNRLLENQKIALSRATNPAVIAALQSAIDALSSLTEKSTKGEFEDAFAESSDASRTANKVKMTEGSPSPVPSPNPTPEPAPTAHDHRETAPISSEDTALTEAKTYLQSVVDGAVNYMDSELEGKLTALYERFNGKDAAFDDLFNKAAEAYSNAMIQAAKAAMT